MATSRVFLESDSLWMARHYLAERIQNGLCHPRDAMVIIEASTDEVVYMQCRNNTVESVLNLSATYAESVRSLEQPALSFFRILIDRLHFLSPTA